MESGGSAAGGRVEVVCPRGGGGKARVGGLQCRMRRGVLAFAVGAGQARSAWTSGGEVQCCWRSGRVIGAAAAGSAVAAAAGAWGTYFHRGTVDASY